MLTNPTEWGKNIKNDIEFWTQILLSQPKTIIGPAQ